jgi:ubiquinone/menaquinone biosynthesis C-methylase UbiE
VHQVGQHAARLVAVAPEAGRNESAGLGGDSLECSVTGSDSAVGGDASFKYQDAASYDPVVEEFERFTERVTLPIATRVVARARLPLGATVLDVGCGTGVITRLAAQAVGANGRVTGIDLSEGMLRKARELADAERIGTSVELVKGDAESLPLPSARFDVVLSLYALRHFPDPARATAEMLRVCKPGGRVIIGVGSAPPLASAASVAAAARRIGDTLKRPFGRAPLYATAYLDALIDRALPQADTGRDASWAHEHGGHFSRPVAELMRHAGFEAVEVGWLGQTSIIQSVEEFWSLQVTLSSKARKRIAAANSADVDRLKGIFERECAARLQRGGRLLYRSGALLTSGQRPVSGKQ